jgi:NADPH-dependent 2,4-dienoyl-CoA reductase/sulfur reductase-like enzyme
MTPRDAEHGRTVVVGASAAGLATATALRRADPQSRITLLGAERHLPYDRPPLSKQVLAGTWAPDQTRLPGADTLAELDIDVVLDDPASALELDERTVLTAGGRRLGADDIVLATGLEARTLPGTEGLTGVHVIRTLDDALALRTELLEARRAVVIGEGVLGCEAAATAAALGCEVALLGMLDTPMQRQLGALVGEHLAELHQRHGVTLQLPSSVDGVDQRAGRIRAVTATGPGGAVETLPADVVIVAVGARPATDWLEGSGLALDDGVVCDSRCRAAPGIWAAGDVARFHHQDWAEPVRLENRTNASAQGLLVAENIAGADKPYLPVPYFWTDQFETKLQIHGRVGPDRPVCVVDGDPAEGRFVVLYGSPGPDPVVTGVLGWNMPKPTRQLRHHILDATPWEAVTTDLASTPA